MTKDRVREIAAKELPFLSEKEESQDFIEGGYHQLFEGKSIPGPILNTNGETIGTHKGIVYYTVGQRRGIGIAHPEPVVNIPIAEVPTVPKFSLKNFGILNTIR